MLLASNLCIVFPEQLYPFAKYAPTFKVLSFSSSFFFFSYIFQEQLKFDAFITHPQSAVFFFGPWCTLTLHTIDRFTLTHRNFSLIFLEINSLKFTFFWVLPHLFSLVYKLHVLSFFLQRIITVIKNFIFESNFSFILFDFFWIIWMKMTWYR